MLGLATCFGQAILNREGNVSEMGGWDVLLSGEKVAIGRMSTDGFEVRGRVWNEEPAGVRVQVEVVGVTDSGEPSKITELRGKRKTHKLGSNLIQHCIDARVENRQRRVI